MKPSQQRLEKQKAKDKQKLLILGVVIAVILIAFSLAM